MVQLKIVYTDGLNYEKLKKLDLIKPEDIKKAEEYKNLSDKTERLISFYLKRKYVGTWELSDTGKPVSADKFFSLSHCNGAVTIALSDKNVGVDIERVKNIDKRLIDYVASEEERDKILTDEDFFKVWTAKESLVKALGTGLTEKPNKIPAFPLNGVKFYRNKTFYSKTIAVKDFIISVTVENSYPFNVDVKESLSKATELELDCVIKLPK